MEMSQILEEAIERAAKGIRDYTARVEVASNGKQSPDTMVDSRAIAEAALRAFAPGLFDGRQWIAPWEATEEMENNGYVVCETLCGEGGQMNSIFSAMRHAYLNAEQKD